MVSKVISQAEARDALDKQDAVRKRAARQASRALAAPQDVPTVVCTVLPQGDGKVSMGEHVGGIGEVHYEEGEAFTLELPVAVALYDRGYVNFPDAREQVAAFKRERAQHRQAALEAYRLAQEQAEPVDL